ncbi:hypothetical protein [Ralstonia mojiangensis]|uniref:hypothetical protein n=1 Tax=Ralstonia mojiangensis TaxID=2953895 RepID=UPI0021B222D1|nr:hypothetical protein [Ralstonia mojiangensis]MCT7328018.1 hypothetical protein [Ralstonia mojiangensis]
MANFRIETVMDIGTGLYRVEVYYPPESAAPFVVGNPIYPSHEAAIADAVEIFKNGLPPNQPITARRII